MSSDTFSDDGRQYKPLPPAKKQKLFPARRRTLRLKASTPALPKKQSSLTQMEWVGTPKETIDISSDKDDDGEYIERPAKRRKQNEGSSRKKPKKNKLEEREAGQSSFTQVDYLALMRRSRRSDVDDEGFQIWQDSDTETDIEPSRHSSPEAVTNAASSELDAADSEAKVLEIPESSQASLGRRKQSQQPDYAADKDKRLQTPRNVRFAKLPTSRNVASTEPSTRRKVRQRRSVSRSPLKERDANIRSPTKVQSPVSQNMSLKMLESTRFRQQQARRNQGAAVPDENDLDLQQCAEEATNDFSLRTFPMPPPPPRTLHRTTTVQDSQAEELDSVADAGGDATVPELKHIGSILDSQRNSSNETLVEESQQQRRPRRLQRVTTIQDSECDETDLEEISLPEDKQPTLNEITNDDTQFQRSEKYPEGTYDPVFSALDRDASRFEWAESQQGAPTADDSETEDEELEDGAAAEQPQEHSAKAVTTSQELGDPTVLSKPDAAHADARASLNVAEGAHGSEAIVEAERDDSAYESGDQAHAKKGQLIPSSPQPLRPSQLREEPRNESAEDVTVPSSPPPMPPVMPHDQEPNDEAEDTRVPTSPPPLRPSQVSTIVPTQLTSTQKPSSPMRTVKPEPFSVPLALDEPQAEPPLTFSSSPQRPSSAWEPESLTSSPLPLPPWSSPERQRAAEMARGQYAHAGFGSGHRLESLVDFSLPPPPPLSSSRRQTPASSSL